MAMDKQSITVLIPVLNEADGLEPLLARLKPVLSEIEDRFAVAWRVLFVDDGSRDGTGQRLAELNAEDPRITALSLSRNFGKEIAITAGLNHAPGDAVIIMDGDLQHPPEVLPSFVGRWREGHTVVYGERVDRETDGPIRKLLSRGFYRIYNFLAKTNIPKGAGDFRLLDRRAVDAMNLLTETSRFNKGLYAWIGFDAVGVPFTVSERTTGETRWSLRRLSSFALDGLTSFSTLPLRVWSLVGAVISLIAFLIAMIHIGRTLIFGADLPGFASLFVSIMFFSGIQLISLGVIGEYLGRVYEEVKARPLYIVARRVGVSAPAPTGSADQPHGPSHISGRQIPGAHGNGWDHRPGNGAEAAGSHTGRGQGR